MRVATFWVVLSCWGLAFGQEATINPKCTQDQDCSSDKGCVEGNCIDLCEGKPCGDHAGCQVHDHHAMCFCHVGYGGDPVLGCELLAPQCQTDVECGVGMTCSQTRCVASECVGKVCATNTTCVAKDGVAKCVCPPELVDDGENVCRPPTPEEQFGPTNTGGDFARSGVNSQHDPNSMCKGNIFPKPKGKKVYHVITNAKMNWYNAYMYCASHGHRLATVESEEENDMILKAIEDTELANNERFFISGNDFLMELRWFWMTTGQPIKEFTYWHVSRPSCSSVLNCLAYLKIDGVGPYRWYDWYCTVNEHFICEDFV